MREEPGSWSEIAATLARRFEVAAVMGYDAVHNPVGSEAIAKVLREMGRKLDIAVQRSLAEPPTAEEAGRALLAEARDGEPTNA